MKNPIRVYYFSNLIGSVDPSEEVHYCLNEEDTVAQGGIPRYYPKHIGTFQVLSQQARLLKLMQFWKALVQYRRHENHPLATRVQLEALLSQYQQVFEG